jgi:type I restriction enzyme S subunit
MLRPYPAYKDSGVPWLGDVPVHWEVRRGKWLFRHRKKINANRRHTNILSLTLRGVVNNDPDDPEGLVPKDYGSYQYFAKGDLVFKLIDLENLRTSRVGLVHEDGIMSPAYVRLVPAHDGLQRFFFQQYYDLYQRGIFNQLGAGVRSTLSPTELLNVPIVVPHIPEQVAVVRFLDHMDRRIRPYIRAKQKLIKLLEEQKQVIIHHAVTRGLDPSVRLKPSGVEWLGDVPEHWEVVPGMIALREKQEKNIGMIEGRVLSLSYGQIIVKPVEKLHGLVPESFETYQIVNPGEIVIRPTDLQNDQKSLRIGLVRDRGIITSAYLCLLPLPPLSPEYTYQLLNAYDLQKVFYQLGSGTRQNLKFSDLKRLPVLAPPAIEQANIAAFIRTEGAAISTAIERAERETDLLREYQTRLIADVVTGKLDVREVAAGLPDEAEKPKPLDDVESTAEGNKYGQGADLDAVPEEAET